MPTIGSRLRADYKKYFSRLHRDYITQVTVWLDDELFLVQEYLHDTDDYYDLNSLQVAKSIVERILKEWTCNSKNTCEQPLLLTKKVLVASCGKLEQREEFV